MTSQNNTEQTPEAPVKSEEYLKDILSMMTTGHKSIRIEKHTFFYWGISGALLTALVAFLYQNAMMLMNTTIYAILCTVILGVVGYFDYRKTRELRKAQDESVSFIQVKMTRIWWLLIGTAILFNVGLMVYGGTSAYSIWFVLIGLAIIIHASFSTQPLARYGFALMAIGIISPALLPYSGLTWVAISVYGIGVPLLGFMLYQESGFWQADKPYAVVVWLLLAVLPGYAVYEIVKTTNQPHIPTTTHSSADYQNSPLSEQKFQIITLPAGTAIPLKLSSWGNLISDNLFTKPSLVLKQSIEVTLGNGKLTGSFRVDQGAWSPLKPWELESIMDFINIMPQEGLNKDAKLGILDRK